jgi:iron complex outermembrane receptor protein
MDMKIRLYYVLAAVAALLPQLAAAQVAGELLEVLVTAQRTESKAQDTPIAMSVYSQEELSDAGIKNIGDLAKSDPSLRITGTYTTNISIRGITGTNNNETGDSTVPVAFDDFYTNRPLTQFGGLYDIERVEVLRGPQGTLFGRNVVGGLLNVYTAKPKDHFEANSSFELGNYNAQNIAVMLNLPLTDVVWMRAAATSTSHSGYRNLYPIATRGDDADSKSARIQLGFHPTEAFDANLLFQWTNVGGTGPGLRQIDYTYYGADGVTTGSPVCVLAGCEPDHVMPSNALSNPDRIQSVAPNYLQLRDLTWRFKMNYQFGNAMTLSYLGGFDNLDWLNPVEVSRRDGTHTNREGTGPTIAAYGPLYGPDVFSQHQTPKTWNHELRLVGDPNARLTWQAGLFYFRERNWNLSQRLNSPYTNQSFAWLQFIYPDIRSDSKAAYAHIIYKLTDTLKASVGARYTHDYKSRLGTANTYRPNGTILTAGPSFGQFKYGQYTWHGGLDWKPNADTLVYLKADKGYKAGGYTNIDQFKPEILLAYELGMKTTFNDRVQLNLAAFNNDYKDQQISTLGANTAQGAVIKNAGRSQIYGLEADVTALLGMNSEVGLHGTYAHGEYKDFSLTNAFGTCPFVDAQHLIAHTRPVCNVQLAGNVTIQTPKISISGSAKHTFVLPSGASLTPSVDARYFTKAYFAPQMFDSSRIDPYTIWDLDAKYMPAEGNWDLTLFVRNVANKTYLTDWSEQQTSGIETYNYGFSPPRTFGGRISYRWK